MTTSYYDTCLSGYCPTSIFSKGDPLKRIRERHDADCKIKLGPNAKEALRMFQSYIINCFEDDLDMCLELTRDELEHVCRFVDRKNGDESGILLRHGFIDNIDDYLKSYSIHLFVGHGKTACGQRTGDVAYLIGEKTYCKECLLATID